MKYAIIMIGPQGSGKGTQGKMLSEKLDFDYAEMGPILKKYAKTNQKDGKVINDCVKKGNLVPDEIVLRAIKNRFKTDKSLILDGVPRKDVQAKGVVEYAREYKFKLLAILLELSDEEAVTRLTSRLICPKCGYEPPYPEVLNKTHCDKCSTKLVKRSDDTEEAIKERLKEYHQKTEPMIRHLEKAGVKIYRFDGRPKVPVIHKKIMDKIKEIGIN